MVAALIPCPADASRFLVQQRLPETSRGNLWEFPGGKVEPGETDEAALKRECQEELAVELQVGRQLWTTTHAYPDLTVELCLYSATILEGVPRALGAQAIEFCTPVQMQQLKFCEADLPLLEELQRGL